MSNAERMGSDLAEVASWAVVSGTVQATLREGRDLTKAVAKLTLFGDEKNLRIRPGDPPAVQVLKQMATDYQRLRDEGVGDGRAANEMLINIGRQLTAMETTKANHLATSFKLLAEQARMQAKLMEKGGGGPTASDLEKILKDSDARGLMKAATLADGDDE